jgi:N-formylglutamate deformylase
MQAVSVRVPAAGARRIALVCDSPHSGTWYPDDFGFAIDRAALRRSEDTHVDVLWSSVVEAGASLVCALFPRSYLDPNRDEADIDVGMIDGPWPREVRASHQCRVLGNGLVWRRTPAHEEIYARRLSVAEVEARIANCWRPYRAALQRELESAWERHGAWYHLNLHSMPSNAYERLGLAGKPLADVVLGDRGGVTCSPDFLAVVGDAFRAEGLSVSVNDPYEGLELIRMSGEPARHRHSLQIEINRALYMDEATREPSSGFAPLKAAIDAVVKKVAGCVQV